MDWNSELKKPSPLPLHEERGQEGRREGREERREGEERKEGGMEGGMGGRTLNSF